MRQALTVLFIMYGLLFTFYFTGLLGTMPNSALIQIIQNPTNITGLSIFNTVLGTLSLVGAATAIVFGYVTKNYELMAFAPIATLLLTSIPDWVAIYNTVAQANAVIATLVIGFLMFAYGFIIIDYWRGRD